MKGRQNTKHLSAFEQGMVEGARHTSLSVSRTATLLDFSHSTVSRMVHDPKRISSQPDTTVGSVGDDMGQASLWNTFDTLSSPCPDELRLF
jgi:hypothetical protein